MGYTVHGLDLSPTLHDTAKALAEAGLPCGQFHEKDFFDFCAKSRRRFAVVASFGFIEHFIEFEKVFTLHCALAKKKGFIVVTFPNYFGVLQYALHSLFDAQGLARHNRDAMRIEPYMKAAAANNCEVLYAGYFGGFRFWRNKSEPLPEDPVLLALHQGIQKLSAQRALTQDAPEWSCLGGIVARKR